MPDTTPADRPADQLRAAAERSPYCHTIRYGVTGAPILTEDEMDGSFAPGVGVDPTLIELAYSTPQDGRAPLVTASVTGRWTRFGKPEPGQYVTTDFAGDPSGWPAWLAEEARTHALVVARQLLGTTLCPECGTSGACNGGPCPLTAEPAPGTDLRERIRSAIANYPVAAWTPENLAGRIMRVVETTAAPPAPADRAAVLRELADEAENCDGHLTVQDLRRMARQAAAGVQPPTTAEARTRIADALAAADGWKWAPGFKSSSPSYQGYLRQADVALAALTTPPAAPAAPEEPTPAPQCSAALLPATDEAVDRCVRHGAHDTHATAAGVRWPNDEDPEL
ncbi:hypothetical protein ACTOXX_34290 [Streptomyces rubiginosohelvolus]|uniref:hypothetical protein n=1 Tax=Streptomyces rubiginosohelvolus TaxID=67362 RepID=UPI003F90E096